MRRRLVALVLAGLVTSSTAVACGGDDDGGGDSPADRITDPIDKAKQTATSAEERNDELEDRSDDGY